VTKKQSPAHTDTRTDAERLADALAEAVAVWQAAHSWKLTYADARDARQRIQYRAVVAFAEWFMDSPEEPMRQGAGKDGKSLVSHPPLARSVDDIECLYILAQLPEGCRSELLRQWRGIETVNAVTGAVTVTRTWSPADLRHVARKRCNEVLEAQRLARR
jgi:hypothetical protein